MSQESPDRVSPSRAARRGFLLSGLAAAGLATFAGARWFNIRAGIEGTDLSAADAHAAAVAGQIILIDIRRPDEWARTGLGEGALPLDMRRPDFASALAKLVEAAPDLPIALICARGVRSARLSARLAEAGFTRIVDVPEGMLGSGAGPGWLKRGLPVVPFSG